MIPLKPCQTRSFRIQPRRRIEICAAGERNLRARPAQRNPDDRVDRFALRRRMILAHTDHPVAPAVNHAIGVTHFGFRRDRLRLSSAVEAIQSLVSEVREIDCAVAYGKTAAAVFVYARAGAERRRREVNRLAIRREFDNDVSAFLLRPGFHPVDGGAINRDLPKTDSSGDDQIRSDRRFPGTVTRDLRFRHLYSSSKNFWANWPLCHDFFSMPFRENFENWQFALPSRRDFHSFTESSQCPQRLILKPFRTPPRAATNYATSRFLQSINRCASLRDSIKMRHTSKPVQ